MTYTVFFNITMSAFVRNDKQQAQLYTAQNLCLNSQWQIH